MIRNRHSRNCKTKPGLPRSVPSQHHYYHTKQKFLYLVLVPNIELGPMCCPKYRPGPPNQESQVLASRLKDILITSELVPLASLVIEPTKYVWVVYMDIVCLSNDGNLFDAIVTSAISALNAGKPSSPCSQHTHTHVNADMLCRDGMSAKIPRVRFDPERQEVVLASGPPAELVPVTRGPSLSAHTFAIMDDETILYDPTLFEEDMGHATLHLVLDHHREIRHLSFLPSPTASLPSLMPNLLDACLHIITSNPRPSDA
ncbi:hypothetical protein VP01_1838g1 [Puccinia sorghi]|uniref:Ribosomal RNA-processing protein 43 n=1 Tax=Puccinia sorghi TaxID=27349 RepID=A0A0L6VDT3_9BASI|nr:hypothetical protein VP01_1838g1 [Puccinia sorghi]